MQEKELTVLSLFDGISCGRVAGKRAGLKISKYYSSEVEPYPIIIADKNWPEDIPYRLGDVRNIDVSTLDKIDLLIGGSPCQSFSLAGKQNGMTTKEDIEVLTLDHYLELKSSGFEFEGQSYLFWEYMRILTDIRKLNPGVLFFLENVNMTSKWEKVLTTAIGVSPIEINSALVSAQNRKRLYWTNIPNVTQPEDKGIFLKDIVLLPTTHKDEIQGLIHSPKAIEYMNRQVKGGRNHWDFKHHSDILNPKSSAVVANFFKGVPYNVFKDWDVIRKFHPVECERLQTLPDGYTAGISDTQRYKAIGNGWTIDGIAHIFKGIINE